MLTYLPAVRGTDCAHSGRGRHFNRVSKYAAGGGGERQTAAHAVRQVSLWRASRSGRRCWDAARCGHGGAGCSGFGNGTGNHCRFAASLEALKDNQFFPADKRSSRISNLFVHFIKCQGWLQKPPHIYLRQERHSYLIGSTVISNISDDFSCFGTRVLRLLYMST